jgi:hypothetical protein
VERELREQVSKAGLSGAKVVASRRQAEFCRWLGLDVVADYSGGDAASPAALQSLVKSAKAARAGLVIANLQEGRQFGEAIARQTGATLVVFSNFPDMTPKQDGFDALLRDNLGQLTAAVGK